MGWKREKFPFSWSIYKIEKKKNDSDWINFYFRIVNNNIILFEKKYNLSLFDLSFNSIEFLHFFS